MCAHTQTYTHTHTHRWETHLSCRTWYAHGARPVSLAQGYILYLHKLCIVTLLCIVQAVGHWLLRGFGETLSKFDLLISAGLYVVLFFSFFLRGFGGDLVPSSISLSTRVCALDYFFFVLFENFCAPPFFFLRFFLHLPEWPRWTTAKNRVFLFFYIVHYNQKLNCNKK
jgi:hypothetical protein